VDESHRNRPAVGIGFRPEAYTQTIDNLRQFEVLEVMVDHYISGGSRVREHIRELAKTLPLVAHGVGLSIGTAVAPDGHYLDAVARTIEVIGSPWYSEHLAFTKVPGRDAAQLLPLPRTPETVECVIRNLEVVRKHINVPLALENITYYFEYSHEQLSEAEFITTVCRESGAFLLLDLENVYINSCNHHYDPIAFIDSLPADLVKGIHVAGGTRHDRLMLDSHDHPVPEEVLGLLRHVLETRSPDTVILERDDRFDCFDEVLQDVRELRGAVADMCEPQVA
jgi:uncharacterized protein (UPF0276 family)